MNLPIFNLKLNSKLTAYQLTGLSSHENPTTPEYINSPAYKLTNSSTHKLINSST